MGPLLYFFTLMQLLFLLSCFNLTKVTHSLPSSQQLCHDDESSALLQFKQSLFINKYASRYSFAYPKILSWRLKGDDDNCCSWDGIECDNHTGHVVGLDISSSFLFGSINSNSTLFRLVHLQRLNLADNHFNYSQIPSAIGLLSRLTSLNLSASAFYGQIPSEILKLSKLVYLDLSFNVYIYPSAYQSLLKLEKPSLSNLVESLTNLQLLYLSLVNISSTVPETMSNLSKLTDLSLRECGLFGNFPSGVFSLPNLHILSIQDNPNLTGKLPEFHRGSLLEVLKLAGTSLSGKLPASVGNLGHLNMFDARSCSFSGQIPLSVGNLIKLVNLDLADNHFTGQIPSSLANLTQLTYLSLSFNDFSSGRLSWIGKQTKLTQLGLASSNLSGVIPCSLQNLTQLNVLSLTKNKFIGEIPSWVGNLTKLTGLSLQGNKFHGPIPQSIFKLTNLGILDLANNSLYGTMEIETFLELKSLTRLQLSLNKLSLRTMGSSNGTLPKLKFLGLQGCNLSEFPKFLQYQDQMEWLDLSHNNLRGLIPRWIRNTGKQTLTTLLLNANFLTGFEQSEVVLPWENLGTLDLSQNLFQGSLPIPPFTTAVYSIADNSLTGEISPLICKLSSLYMLALANNFLNGTIPPCLSNFSDFLTVMILFNNSFQGTIPQAYNKGSNLKVVDLSQNQLNGPVPRSLANCKMLKILNLENNQITDIFPFWLGILPEMKFMNLRKNRFHGPIEGPLSNLDFPKLSIIDISCNGFSGQLPSKYFEIWRGMKVQEDIEESKYAETQLELLINSYQVSYAYSYRMRITHKGVERLYEKIQSVLKAIDLSGNKFEGKIPESIGILKGLQLLNLSNNALTGPIPASLGNLTALESLDLSQNELSGDIPQQLVQLTFLEVFNVSYNHLTGSIPRGNQFSAFDNSSFGANSGLCGEPLSKKCESSAKLPSSTSNFDEYEDKDEDFPSKIDLLIICLGYLSGIIVGLVIGKILTTRYHYWFETTFGKQAKWRRGKKRGQRN